MKIINEDIFVHDKDALSLLESKGLTNHHRQYTVYCRCRGLKHASSLVEGVATKFCYGYASEGCSDTIRKYFEAHPEVDYIITTIYGCVDYGPEGPCDPLANPVINENKMVTSYEIKQYKAGKKEQL